MRTSPLVAVVATLALIASLSACRTTSMPVPAWAFGVTLGTVLDKTTAQPMDALIAGRALYRVRPPSPHRSVSNYAAIADRESGELVGIVGWDRYSDGAACQGQRKELEQVLERRYGRGRPSAPADRERMHGLPESLSTPDLTVYPGWQGPVAVGCAGPRLVIVYWYFKPEPDAPATHS